MVLGGRTVLDIYLFCPHSGQKRKPIPQNMPLMIKCFFCRQVYWNKNNKLGIFRKLFGQVCPSSAQNMLKICPKICSKYAQNMPQNMLKICSKYAPKYADFATSPKLPIWAHLPLTFALTANFPTPWRRHSFSNLSLIHLFFKSRFSMYRSFLCKRTQEWAFCELILGLLRPKRLLWVPKKSAPMVIKMC